jgi:hypothetical protein
MTTRKTPATVQSAAAPVVALRPERQESKREKFKRLCNARTKRALKAIRMIGKLGNHNAYEFDDDDVTKVTEALTAEVDRMAARFQDPREQVEFEL